MKLVLQRFAVVISMCAIVVAGFAVAAVTGYQTTTIAAVASVQELPVTDGVVITAPVQPNAEHRAGSIVTVAQRTTAGRASCSVYASQDRNKWGYVFASINTKYFTANAYRVTFRYAKAKKSVVTLLHNNSNHKFNLKRNNRNYYYVTAAARSGKTWISCGDTRTIQR